MNRVAKQYVLPYLWITLASAVYAVGFNWCYEPNQIGFGGITGVGQIINHILPWAPIGTVVIILNIPCSCWGGSCWAGTCWCPPFTPCSSPPFSSIFSTCFTPLSLWSPFWGASSGA